MTYQTLLFHQDNHLATITLNRPEKRNAFNGTMVGELSHVLTHIAETDRLHTVMIQGAGDHFCAGADLAWMKHLATASKTENLADAQQLADLLYQLHSFPKPTIVLAQGATMGGGLGLLAACDIAYAECDAVFAFSEVTLGLAPATISPYVVSAIGERLARYYFLTGQRFSAETAHRMHLVHDVYGDPAALLNAGHSLAHTLSQYSTSAISHIKELLTAIRGQVPSKALATQTATRLAECRTTEDAIAGLNAFFDRVALRGAK